MRASAKIGNLLQRLPAPGIISACRARRQRSKAHRLAALMLLIATPIGALAHHSFAMYDRNKLYVLTGVVDNLNPDPSHLQIVFVALNEERNALVRDAAGERINWAVDMDGAAASAREGISQGTFTRGTVFSVALNPLRNGEAGGTRVGVMFRCPPDTAPPPGQHCDAVPGAIRYGEGELPAPTEAWQP